MEMLVPWAESILQGAEQENLRVSAMNVGCLKMACPLPNLSPHCWSLLGLPPNCSNWILKDGGGLELGLAIALAFILSLAAQ